MIAAMIAGALIAFVGIFVGVSIAMATQRRER